MTTRENELDEVTQGQDRPYIHKPDKVDVDLGGLCFLDRNRVCGPDCTAFVDPAAPTAIERCLLLGAVAGGIELLSQLVKPRASRPPAPDVKPPSPFSDR